MGLLLFLLWTAGLAHAGPAVALDRHPEAVLPDSLQIPTAAAPAPTAIPITSGWRLVMTAGGVRTWETPLPARPRTLFFHRPPGDMSVHQGERRLQHLPMLEKPARANSWTFTSHALQVRRAVVDGPPQPGEYTLHYSDATGLEDKLRYNPAMETATEVVFQQLQLDDTTRSGLLLPAPATLAFQITVPEGEAVLDLEPLLLPPEAGDPALRSDGADLILWINEEEEVARWSLSPERALGGVRVSLAAWAGQTVTLRLETAPGADAALDYVFVADPVVHVPDDDPPRVVVIFIDTLRADHMSLYGYARPTTPRLDRWAEGAAVFTQARSVAPWTLPSARTMVTGLQPERWSQATPVQETLAREGWATTFIAGNIYLSSNFEMARGWGSHRCINWPIAGIQVDRALDYLRGHADRPVFMMLHFMDMHLPYTEPPTYRYRFAGAAPDALSRYSFHRSDVIDAAKKMGPEGKQYVRDRYDNNLRYIDDQLARFLRHLDERDTVLIIADHGEEFWDHKGFEHGHTLYDELLRVPLIAKGPSFVAGRFDAPVSLLDVAPSILTALGVSPEGRGMEGLPLQTLADGSATATFQARPQAFGRPLYGVARWGSLADGQKYLAWEGKEDVYDLRADPGEQVDLQPVGVEAGRAALAAALQTEVPLGFRLSASRPNEDKQDMVAILQVPGGIRKAWAADDPTQRSRALVETLDAERVQITWDGNYTAMREVYVTPVLPAEEAIQEAALTLAVGREEAAGQRGRASGPPTDTGQGLSLLRGRVAGRTVNLTYAVVPLPRDSDGALIADPCAVVKTCFELLALGYVDNCDTLVAENPGCAR